MLGLVQEYVAAYIRVCLCWRIRILLYRIDFS